MAKQEFSGEIHGMKINRPPVETKFTGYVEPNPIHPFKQFLLELPYLMHLMREAGPVTAIRVYQQQLKEEAERAKNPHNRVHWLDYTPPS